VAVVVTVNGVDRTSLVHRGSIRLSKTVNGRDTCEVSFVSGSSAFRPSTGQELTIAIDGSLPAGFGGLIRSFAERAVFDPKVGWLTTVRAVNFTAWCDEIIVDDLWIANGLWDRVNWYATEYLAPRFGTTYGGPTTGGPALAAGAYQFRTLTDVFNELSRVTGYAWNIGGDKLLSWSLPGAVAGTNLTAATGGAANGGVQSISKSFERLTNITRSYVRVAAPEGTDTDAAIPVTSEIHTAGTTGQTEFPLRYRPIVVAPTQVKINGAAAITLPSGVWSYSASKKAIVASAGQTAGTTVEIVSYESAYPCTVVYDIGALPIREMAPIDAAAGSSLAQALALGQALVSENSGNQPAEVKVWTRQPGYYCLMALTLTFSDRNVSGAHWIKQIDISDDPKTLPSDPLRLRYVLTCVEGTGLTRTWQHDLKDALSSGGGTSGVTTIGVSGTSGGGGGGVSGSFPLAMDRNAGTYSASYVGIGVPFYLDGDKVPAGATVRLRAERKTDNAGTSVTVRLRNLTDSTDAASVAASTSTTWAEATATFTPPSGLKKYELQLTGSNATNRISAVGVVDVLPA
jgi:hypothetical protein